MLGSLFCIEVINNYLSKHCLLSVKCMQVHIATIMYIVLQHTIAWHCTYLHMQFYSVSACHLVITPTRMHKG